MEFNFHLIWELLASIITITYFFLLKYYVKNHNINILILVILLELLAIFLYYKSLQKTGSAIVYSIITAASLLLGVFIAVIFFREKIYLFDVI